jgi:hypothetical protein
MNKPKVRESNLELFRIVVMILIVAHHYVVNSGLLGASSGPIFENLTSFKSVFLLIAGAWGKTGINCFVLITGYFMCKSKITLAKFLKLLGIVMFYKIIIYFIFVCTSYIPFSIGGLIKAFLPITSVSTGFTEAYLLFFLAIPFLNILINNLTEKQHLLLILLTTFIYVFFGTLPFFAVTMNYVSWFSVLYFIASYIRLYPKKIFSNTKVWGIATLVTFAVSVLSILFGIYISGRFGRDMSHYFVTDSNTLLAVLLGLSSFLFFKNLKIKNSKFINTVSATCFGVLQIHANSDAMRSWLWGDTLNNVKVYYTNYMVLHFVLSVIGIFAVCSVIEMLRIKFVEKPFFKYWDKKAPLIEGKLKAICQKYNFLKFAELDE